MRDKAADRHQQDPLRQNYEVTKIDMLMNSYNYTYERVKLSLTLSSTASGVMGSAAVVLAIRRLTQRRRQSAPQIKSKTRE